jgi:hypothetical protein
VRCVRLRTDQPLQPDLTARHEFHDRYWKFRPPYDLGQSDRAYWSPVLGHELQAEPQLVEAMVRVDVAGWTTLNTENALAATALGLQAVRCVTGCERRRVRLAQWS